jgi:hypothetical protein
MKERLIEFLAYLGIGQTKFEERVNLSRGFVNKFTGNLTMKSLDKIAAVYPELNLEWLKTGEGSMIRSGDVIQTGRDNINVGGYNSGSGNTNIGAVNGGIVHNGRNKDKVIDELKKERGRSYAMLCDELKTFHEKLNRKDDYIRGIVEKSFERNEEQMRRIDALIEVVSSQSRKVQEANDKLLSALLEKKLQ